jgi:Bacterial regulatory proteins, luxR family
MTEKLVRLAPREQQIVDLLLQGCDNSDIAKQLKMARRTVKAHFNRLFLRFDIHGGIKRVKLATLLYRRQLCSEANATVNAPPANESSVSSNLSPRGSRTKKSQTQLEPLNTSSKITYAVSTTSSDFGTELNLPSGTKPGNMKAQRKLDELTEWNEGPPLTKTRPRTLQRAAASWD